MALKVGRAFLLAGNPRKSIGTDSVSRCPIRFLCEDLRLLIKVVLNFTYMKPRNLVRKSRCHFDHSSYS